MRLTSAAMHFRRTISEELIPMASRRCCPTAPDCLSCSDPARSTSARLE